MATYTTLGIGDLHPTGATRLIASVDSLNGLVLIGWSASFTYLTMEEFWGRGGSERARHQNRIPLPVAQKFASPNASSFVVIGMGTHGAI